MKIWSDIKNFFNPRNLTKTGTTGSVVFFEMIFAFCYVLGIFSIVIAIPTVMIFYDEASFPGSTKLEAVATFLVMAIGLFAIGFAANALMKFVKNEDRHGATGFYVGLFGIPLFFAFVYILVPQPCIAQSDPIRGALHNSLYFSYTTYTTLGYGDMTPVGWCRVVAMIEAMTGYIFMAYVAALFIRKMSNEDKIDMDGDKK